MSAVSQIEWQTLGPRVVAAPVPVACEPVAALEPVLEFLRAARSAAAPVLIVVNDPARATPTRWGLQALARRLKPAERPVLNLLVATGTHRFEPAERTAFERDTLAGCGIEFGEVAWHDCTATDELAALPHGCHADGCSRRHVRDRSEEHVDANSHRHGTLAAQDLAALGDACHINRRVIDHNWLLAIGSVEPHYFAGVTGAHKTLTIGCLARKDIERNHAGALHPASDLLALDGNPVFDGIAVMMRALLAIGKRCLAFNQVAVGGAPLAAACGDWRATLDALLPLVRDVFVHELAQAADVLHLRVPAPLGRDLYQADKAFKNCHRALRDGGGIVLEADCPRGVGPDAFLGLLRRCGDYAAACEAVERAGYRLSDHKAVKLRYLMDPRQRGVHVALVSRHLRAEQVQGTGLTVFAEVAAALDWLRDRIQGPLCRGVRIEDAGMVCVVA